ncbi:MAG: hypothetical protein ABI465_09090 [Ktedonobacteraceae bacterium]
MQQKDQSLQQSQKHAVSSSLRTQRILDFLEEQWGRSQEPAHDDFKRIIKSVLNIPEEYRTIALTTVAEHLVNGMGLHLLALMATFHEKAEQEGISLWERQATLDDVLPEAFQTLDALSKQVSVRSLDELAALSNITSALYTLSSTKTAEEAQKWLYELPGTYLRRLRQAGLLVDEQEHSQETPTTSSVPTTPFVNWQTSYIPNKNQVVQEIGSTGIGVSTYTPIVPSKPIPVSVETNDPNLAA